MNGTFASPNFPGNYPNNARCEWRIQVPYGCRVRLSFTAFYTESGFDFVEISSNSTGLHQRYSGSMRPPSLMGGQRMVARFRSDGLVNGRGFRAQFTAINDTLPTRFPTTQAGKNERRKQNTELPSGDLFSQMIFDLAKNLIRINYLVFVQFLLQ